MPPLTSAQLLRARTLDAGRRIERGELQYLRNLCRDVPAHRRTIDRLLATPTRDVPPSYRLPWANIGPPVTHGALSPADLAWLNRLPADPDKVSDADARALARLALQVKDHEGDARLVASVFGPVRELHEKRFAAAERQAVTVDQQDLHPATVDSSSDPLVQAIRVEDPELSESEALVRAREQVQSSVSSINRERAVRRADATRAAGGDAA